MSPGHIVSLLLLSMALASCDQPKGKEELKAAPEERALILKACADGTHPDARECSNAKSVDNADKLDRSL